MNRIFPRENSEVSGIISKRRRGRKRNYTNRGGKVSVPVPDDSKDEGVGDGRLDVQALEMERVVHQSNYWHP